MPNPPPPPPPPPPGRRPTQVPHPGQLPHPMPRGTAPPPPPPQMPPPQMPPPQMPPPRMPTVACPFCNQMMQAPPQMAGQVVACPHCRGQIEMPGAPAGFPGQPGPYGQAPAQSFGNSGFGTDPYGAPVGGFPLQANNLPLQFNTGASSRSSSSSSSSYKSSYKRKKSSGGIIPMLMMVATGIWLVAMPLVYLYITTSLEAEIAANPNKVVMTRRGPVTANQARELGGIAATWGAFCCPTTFYAVAMVILLVAMAVSSSSDKRRD